MILLIAPVNLIHAPSGEDEPHQENPQGIQLNGMGEQGTQCETEHASPESGRVQFKESGTS
jgi:hypothetical protein